MFSLIVEKSINFLIMVLAARMMSVLEFGSFSFVKSIVSSLLPFSGMGGNHSLLRYGMQTKTLTQQYKFLFSALFYGSIFSLILIVLLWKLVGLSTVLDQTSELFFNLFVFYILSYYMYDLSRNFFRLIGQNHRYAFHAIVYSFISLLLSSITLVFFTPVSFVISLLISPIIAVLLSNINFHKYLYVDFSFDHEFWKYGFLIGLGAFVNQFFLQADIIILGFINTDLELIAQYKIASLLVFTFLFIPNSFLIRDFTLLVEKSSDYIFLRQYLRRYFKYSILTLFFLVPLFYIFSDMITVFVFGEELRSKEGVQNILLLGFVSAVLLRMPFANILNAAGKAKWNVYNAVLTLVLTVGLLLYFTNLYGVLGAACVISCMYLLSGVISFFLCVRYFRTGTDYQTVGKD